MTGEDVILAQKNVFGHAHGHPKTLETLADKPVGGMCVCSHFISRVVITKGKCISF